MTPPLKKNINNIDWKISRLKRGRYRVLEKITSILTLSNFSTLFETCDHGLDRKNYTFLKSNQSRQITITFKYARK